MDKTLQGLIGLLVFVSIVSIIIVTFFNIQEESREHKKQFFRKEIKGTIYLKRKKRTTVKVYLNKIGSEQLSIIRSSNFKYNPSTLGELIQKGDSIYKPANSNDLYIIRNNYKYYFKVGEHINRHLR